MKVAWNYGSHYKGDKKKWKEKEKERNGQHKKEE